MRNPMAFSFISHQDIFRYLKLVKFIVLFWLIVGCSSDDESIEQPPVAARTLESAELIAQFSIQELIILTQLEGIDQVQEEVKYGVDVYKISYRTLYKDDTILASGLVCLPVGAIEAPILSNHHGTEYEYDDAPTVYKNGFTGFELFASLGYITSIPDYIGYGISKEILHPYYNYTHSAGAVIDMILAAKELAEEKKLVFNDQLFLTGYSEGGYVTLATHKAIQEHPELGLKVTASAAGAGGYNLIGIMHTFFTGSVYSRPDYLTFLLYSYITTLEWDRSLSFFFQEPFADRIPELFNGEHGGGEVAAQLTTSLAQLFTPHFLQAINEKSDAQLMDALEANSVDDWTPQAPIQLYHGVEDDYVPVIDSQNTYEAFLARGAERVAFYPIEGADHRTGLIPMIEGVVPFFQSFR